MSALIIDDSIILELKAVLNARIRAFIQRLTQDPRERKRMLELWEQHPKSRPAKPLKPKPVAQVELVLFRGLEGTRVDPLTSLVFDKQGRAVGRNVRGKTRALGEEDVEWCQKQLIPYVAQIIPAPVK